MTRDGDADFAGAARHLSRSTAVRPDPFWDLRGRVAPRGEERLAFAVLDDAVSGLLQDQDPWKVPSRLFRREAERWIRSRDRASLFSFENVCSILALDAEKTRARIRRWRAAEQTMQQHVEPGIQKTARGSPTHPPTPFSRSVSSTRPGPGRSQRPAPGHERGEAARCCR